LLVAAGLALVEALLIAAQGVLELFVVDADRLTMGLTTTVFFLAYGAGLAVCAWALTRCRSWARAPVVVAQLIQAAVAWSFWGGATTLVAIGLAVLAVLVLVGIFHPASIRALSQEAGAPGAGGR
jgi:hypothetical protein